MSFRSFQFVPCATFQQLTYVIVQVEKLKRCASHTAILVKTNSEVGLDRDLDLTGRDNAALALECGWVHMVVTGPSTDATDENLGGARARVVLQLAGLGQRVQAGLSSLSAVKNNAHAHAQFTALNSH
jgi:hypothetical protein